jgi:hypothetical protein
MTIKTNAQIAREDNIMGWYIILMIVLFIGATCKASQNVESSETTQETK